MPVGVSLRCDLALAADGILAGEIDSALVVHAENHNLDFVADGNNVLHFTDTLGVKLGDVDKSLLTGCIFNEAADRNDSRNLTGVDGAWLGILDDCVNDGQSLVRVVLVDCGDKDTAVVLDVDLVAFVSAQIFWMTLPPEPMTSRIFSVSILVVIILGAYFETSSRGAAMTGVRTFVDDIESCLCGSFPARSLMISGVRPSIFRSIWIAVMPLCVPATLKSMSPKKSSSPWMSIIVIQRSPSVISPQEIPATGALIGTPASISASVEPQTEACEVEPLEDRTSDTQTDRIGEFLNGGKHGNERALRQRAVPDFAAAGAAARLWLRRRSSRAYCSGAYSASRFFLVDAVKQLSVAESCRAWRRSAPESGLW